MLVEEVYALSRTFPPDERFGLTAQLRRAVVSIPSNIAEGSRLKRRKAFLYHLDVALGSQGEVEVQLEIAKRLGNTKAGGVAEERVARVGRMLNGLIESLQPCEGDWSQLQPLTTNHQLPTDSAVTSFNGAIRSSTNVFHSWHCGHCQSGSVLR